MQNWSDSGVASKPRPQRVGWLLLAGVALLAGCGKEPTPEPSSLPPSHHEELPWPPFQVDRPLNVERALDLSWRYVPKGAPAELSPEFVDQAIRKALGEWQGLSPGIRATRTRAPDASAFLTLSWHGRQGDTCSFPYWDSGLAHVLLADAQDGGRYLHMNAEASELRSPETFASMLRHELGHVLGLGHTDPSSKGVMAPSAAALGTTIGGGANAGIASLYGPLSDRGPGPRDLVIRKANAPPGRSSTWFEFGHPNLRARLLDTDGDDHPEALLWLDRRIGPLIIVHFDKTGRMRKTAGPFVGFTLATRSTKVGRHKSGELIAVHTDSAGRRVASRLRTELDGRPGDPWPSEKGLEIDLDSKEVGRKRGPENKKSGTILVSEQGWIVEGGR